MTNSVFENQVITQTVMADNLLTGFAIGTFQEDFQLCEADFLRLRNEGTPLVSWSLNILFATFGYGLSILPKWISDLMGKAEKVSQSEWATFAIGLGFSLLLFFVSKALPNEKTQLMKKMEQHFKTAPKTRQAIRGQK